MSIPPLTAEEAATVAANRGLVNFVLRRRRTPAWEWDDAYQDGLIGLMRAVQKFEPERGLALSTYAMFWIRQSINIGQGRFEGVDFRHAKAFGLPTPDAPVSLDAPVPGLDGEVTLELTASADVENEALARIELAEVEAIMRAVCRDSVDRDVAAAMLTPRTKSWRKLDLEIGSKHGLSHEAIRQRRLRIRERLRYRCAA